MNNNQQLRSQHIPVPHEYKGGDTVEDGHHEIGQSQVDQKVVGDAPHSTVSCGREYNQSFQNYAVQLCLKQKVTIRVLCKNPT